MFAGAGGLAEGFRQAGWQILSGADSSACAGQTFRRNFPEATFFEGDIASLDPSELLRDAGLRRGQLGCLIGGPPCQSFSYNNHARSASDERARLFRRYLRLVRALRPKSIVMENVPGILTIGGGAVVTEIRRRLARLGYETGVRILYAEDYGVPQERRRVFIIGTRLAWTDRLFPLGTHGPAPKPSVEANPHVHRWVPVPGRPAKPLVTVWGAIGDLPRVANGDRRASAEYHRAPASGYQRAMRRGSGGVLNHRAHELKPMQMRRIAEVPEGGNWRDIPRRLLPAGMKRALTKDHTKRYGRLRRRGLCCTILTKCDPHWGSYVHPTQNRTITVREAARIQSFPDRFVFCGHFNEQYAQVGNAVPPAMAAAVAGAVRRHVESAARSALFRESLRRARTRLAGRRQARRARAGIPTPVPPTIRLAEAPGSYAGPAYGSDGSSLASTAGSPTAPHSTSGSRARNSRRGTPRLAA